MDLTGEYTIPAPRQKVWDALNDPEALKASLPGCEEMEKVSDTEFVAKITAKIGAVRAKLKGKVELSEIDAPNSYKIAGSGQGGVAGFAKGCARVFLSDGPDGSTILRYEAQADLGGKLAAVGSRVIQGVAKKMADDFFGKFAKVVSGEAESTAPAPSEAATVQPQPAGSVHGKEESAGVPDWVKCAVANAVVSIIAVAAAVALVSN